MNKEEIKHLAALARIRITDNEIPAIAAKLARVLEYVSSVQSAQASVEETPKAGALRNVMREDGTPHETGAYTEDILHNAPQEERGYIKVKKIL